MELDINAFPPLVDLASEIELPLVDGGVQSDVLTLSRVATLFLEENTLFEKGSHLVVDFGCYRHHGIYVGDDQVVHFGRGLHDLENACVEVVSCDVFCAGRTITVKASPVTFELDEIVRRARSRVGERGYRLFDNNCEHFVNWCRRDIATSQQSTILETVVRQAAAIGTRSTVRKAITSIATRSAAARLPVLLARGTTSVLLASDALQATAELAASSRGKNQQEVKTLGRSVGATSSATLGFAVGGPAGAAASVGLWLTGQAFGQAVLDGNKDHIESMLAKVSRRLS